MGLKHHLQVSVWAVGVASAGAALADLPDDLPASHQNVKVYMGTNPTDFRPRNATLVVETDVIKEIKLPFGSMTIKVWGPKCDDAASPAECKEATEVYAG